jgi:hypothetical protein
MGFFGYRTQSFRLFNMGYLHQGEISIAYIIIRTSKIP